MRGWLMRIGRSTGFRNQAFEGSSPSPRTKMRERYTITKRTWVHNIKGNYPGLLIRLSEFESLWTHHFTSLWITG